MAAINVNLSCDLQKPIKVQYLDGILFSQDNQANIINVEVLNGEEPATISGDVTANVIRSDGGTVAVTGGSISDNVCSIALPSAAYYVPGVVSIVVKLTTSGVITTIAAVVANVYQSSTDTIVDPGTIIPSIQTLISSIETAVASIPADYSSLWTSLAPAFNSSANYVAGQYVTYNGGLYRFTTAHSGTWSSSDVVAVNIGGDLSDLKSAFKKDTKAITGNEIFDGWSENHKYINTGGTVGSVVNIDAPTTTASNVRYMVIQCSAGDVFEITSQGGSGSRAYAFLNSEKEITANRAGSNASLTDYVVTAEVNGYLVVNDTTLVGYVIKNKYLKTRVNDLETNSLVKRGSLTSSDDLNNVTAIGMYSISANSLPANMPYNIGGLLVVTENGLISQVFYGRGAEYHRTKTLQGWTEWKNYSVVFALQNTLSSSDDLNNITTNGTYNFSSSSLPANAPSSVGGLLNVYEFGGTVQQNFYGRYEEYHRIKTSAGWTGWLNHGTPFVRRGSLTSADDLNNILDNGCYKINGISIPANSPIDQGGILLVFYAENAEQVYYTRYKEYHRFYSASGWGDWSSNETGSAYGLPVLKLNGDITNMTKDTSVTLDFQFLGQTGTADVKWQGSSSLRYAKKNYTIKLSSGMDAWNLRQIFVNAYRASVGDVSRVDTTSRWGTQKKFVGKANWIDSSMLRNVVCARLWGEIVKSRVDNNEITDGRATAPNYGAIDGFPIEVEINGASVGLYTFNIPKDKWTFDMGSESTEYLVTGENNYSQACRWKALATFDEDQTTGERDVDFDYEYIPDGVTEETVKTSFNTAIQAVIDAHENWETDVAPYLDVGSVFDYFIFSCCITNEDGFAKNLIYGTYDGSKWFLSAYDMDSTFGANVYGSGIYDVVSPRAEFEQAANFNRLAHLIVKYSKDRLKTRYNELRSGILSESHVLEVMTRFAIDIPDTGYQKDRAIWTGLPGTSTSNIAQYMNFYKAHCAYLDNEVANL